MDDRGVSNASASHPWFWPALLAGATVIGSVILPIVWPSLNSQSNGDTSSADGGNDEADRIPSSPEIDLVFILGGQSNMAGRGVVSELPPSHQPSSSPSSSSSVADERILRWTADGAWTIARDPLHRDIDLKKSDKCGVGPGLIFARHLLRKRQLQKKWKQNEKAKQRKIGLIPCAHGGASMDDWRVDGPMYAQMVKRTLAAVASLQDNIDGDAKKKLAGLLWYQGESDGTTLEQAKQYGVVFRRWLERFRRDIGCPDLPIVFVVPASRSPRTPYITEVRETQQRMFIDSDEQLPLAYAVAVDVEQVVVPGEDGDIKDAFHDDLLHLNTAAQVRLGEAMVQAYLRSFVK